MEHVLRQWLHQLRLTLAAVVMRLAPSPKHMVFVGANSSDQLCAHISRLGLKKILLVTDKPLTDLGLVARMVASLKKGGLEAVVYDGVLPDPTYQIVENGLAVLKQHACDGVLALGGGSVIDAAKVIAMAATNPGDLKSFVGYFKAKQPVLPFFSIPTTSGTGSEATMGAVISDTLTHEKTIIGDPKLCPLSSALDPTLMTGLPPQITAATGMDALTHAIEAYIGVWGSDRSNGYAKAAVKMIFDNVVVAYNDGANIEAREQMALAAYYAGLAIGEVNVGNVHAIAHQLGSQYSLPHGLANAMVMPHVLHFSKHAAQQAMADLAIVIDLGSAADSRAELADKLIGAVIALNKSLGIPSCAADLLRDDIRKLSTRATKEAFAYPVPILMRHEDCESILYQLLAGEKSNNIQYSEGDSDQQPKVETL
jgi:alcohol dehydrogenase class IV